MGQKMATALEEAEAAKALEEAEGAMAKAGKILGEVYGLTYMEAEAAVRKVSQPTVQNFAMRIESQGSSHEAGIATCRSR